MGGDPCLAEVERDDALPEELGCDRRDHALTPSFVPDDLEVRGLHRVHVATYPHRCRDGIRPFPHTISVLGALPDLPI